MGLFDRFKKKPKESVLPDEVKSYYDSKSKEKKSAAFLLGLLTLVITLIVASGLFYGVRYAYRALTDNDTSETANVEQNETDESIPGDELLDDDTADESAGDGQDSERDTSSGSNRDTAGTSGRASTPETGDSLPATGDPGL